MPSRVASHELKHEAGRGGLPAGWSVVAASAIGLFFGAFPIVVFSFGVFVEALAQEYRAPRGAIALAFTIHNVCSGVVGMVIGRVLDRTGPRAVVIPGVLLLGSLLIAALAIGPHLWHVYLFYAALGVVAPATTTVPYALTVSRWFDRRRGVALGTMMVGLGLGAVAMPVVAQALIVRVGWRPALAVVGGAILLVGLPVVAGFLTLPQRIPASPGRDDTGRIAGAAPSVSGVTWADARRSGTFWRMVGGFALLSACVHACVVHIPAVLVSGGATPPSVVLASASAGVALLVGRVGCGWLLDRMHAGGVATAVCAGVTCGIALLAVGPGPGASLVSAALIGLGLGAEVDLIAFLLSRYFGLRALGSTMGFAFGVFVLAGGVGPLALGVAFDRTGSYGLPLLGFATASATAGLLLSGLGPYRFLASQESPATPTTDAGREGAIS